MPAHAEIIIGTPNHDFFDALGSVPQRARKCLRVPLNVGEDPVAAFLKIASSKKCE
jgi:hypothetical protein